MFSWRHLRKSVKCEAKSCYLAGETSKGAKDIQAHTFKKVAVKKDFEKAKTCFFKVNGKELENRLRRRKSCSKVDGSGKSASEIIPVSERSNHRLSAWKGHITHRSQVEEDLQVAIRPGHEIASDLARRAHLAGLEQYEWRKFPRLPHFLHKKNPALIEVRQI